MQKLYVKNRRIDLGFQKINLNIQMNDLGSIESRNSTYSNTIKIPKTAVNVDIFEMAGIISSETRLPYKKIRCKYFENGVDLVSDGFLVVREVDDQYYTCNIYDGIIDLSEKIGDKKLTDLNFCDYNHVLDLQGYYQNMENTEDFIYALANFGDGELLKIQAETQSPSLFVHSIFKKILKEADVNYFGDFFKKENEDFLDEVFTCTKGTTTIEEQKIISSKGECATNEIVRGQTSYSFIRYRDTLQLISNNFTSPVSVISILNTISFSNQVPSYFRIKLEIEYTNNNTFLDLEVYKKNQKPISIQLPESNSKTINKDLVFECKIKDAIFFKVKSQSKFDENINKHRLSFKVKIVSAEVEEIEQGNIVKFKEIVPGMSQKDFVKDVMQRHGLMFKKTKDNPDVYEFKKMDVLLNDRKKAIDYSSKLNQIIKTNYRSNYAKINTASFKYTSDKGINDKDGVIYSNDENAKEVSDLFSSPFQIATSKYSRSQTPVYDVPLYERDETNNIKIKDTPVKIFKLLFNPKTNITINIFFFSYPNSYTKTRYYYLSLRNIDLQTYLKRNYKSFENIIQNYKETDAVLAFNSVDFRNFDFFKLLYFNQTGSYHYANVLKNSGKINLVKISNFLQNMPPDNIGTFEFEMNFGQTKKISIFNLIDSGYSDPEGDEPYEIEVKPINDGHTDFKLFNGTTQITTSTVFNVNDLSLDLKVVDTGSNQNQRIRSFDYRFSDVGSETFPAIWGKVIATIAQYQNIPPVADAGQDQFKTVPNFQNSFSYFVDGSNSSDPNGEIVKYKWTIHSKPSTSTAVINQAISLPSDPPVSTAELTGDNTNENMGTYTLKLEVTDDLGATDTDMVNIKISQQI